MRLYIANKKVHDYCCLMLDVDVPIANWNAFTKELIKPMHIYNTRDNEYGMETKPHITLLYGLHKGIEPEEFMKYLPRLKDIDISLTGIGMFENEKYDVLKFDVESEMCNEINEILAENFECTNEYDGYEPHITISYMKCGTAKKYCSSESLDIVVKPKGYWYNDTEKDIRFKI